MTNSDSDKGRRWLHGLDAGEKERLCLPNDQQLVGAEAWIHQRTQQ